jgi:hypothetical protein
MADRPETRVDIAFPAGGRVKTSGCEDWLRGTQGAIPKALCA